MIYIRASTNVDLLISKCPYLVHIRLSTASPKCVASSGRMELDRSLLLSLANLPSLSITRVLFMLISVYLHLLPLKRTWGKRGSTPLRMLAHNRYLSCCGGSMPLWTTDVTLHPFFLSLSIACSL